MESENIRYLRDFDQLFSVDPIQYAKENDLNIKYSYQSARDTTKKYLFVDKLWLEGRAGFWWFGHLFDVVLTPSSLKSNYIKLIESIKEFWEEYVIPTFEDTEAERDFYDNFYSRYAYMHQSDKATPISISVRYRLRGESYLKPNNNIGVSAIVPELLIFSEETDEAYEKRQERNRKMRETRENTDIIEDEESVIQSTVNSLLTI